MIGCRLLSARSAGVVDPVKSKPRDNCTALLSAEEQPDFSLLHIKIQSISESFVKHNIYLKINMP